MFPARLEAQRCSNEGTVKTKKISKVLIANRGEIALRIIRACKELGIKSVVVFSEVDVNGVWVRKADECYPIMGDPIQAYLDYSKIISLAKKADCDAIHPGYGFLAENADFAEICANHDIVFIGPSPECIRSMGDKATARATAIANNVPLTRGTDGVVKDVEAAKKFVNEVITYPVIIKATAGGGGKGMRIARNDKELDTFIVQAQNEAKAAFGNPDVYIEKYVEEPKHVEIQIIGDKHGHVVHLGERDCSIQRRHQKLIEEAPSVVLT